MLAGMEGGNANKNLVTFPFFYMMGSTLRRRIYGYQCFHSVIHGLGIAVSIKHIKMTISCIAVGIELTGK